MQEKNQQMYMDIQQLPDEEVFRMSSEALRIADRNTALYMLHELQAKVRQSNGEPVDNKDEHQELEIEEKSPQQLEYEEMLTEEMLRRSSEALKIADRNTVKYMIEEMQKEIQEKTNLQIQSEESIRQSEESIRQSEESIKQSEENIRRLDEIGRQSDEINKRLDKIRRQLEESIKPSEENLKQMKQELDATEEEIEELQAMLASKQ